MNTTATTLSPPVLAARDIRKSYGKGTARFDALAGVSLSVYAGESIAIVGKSGSGKSTLMHLLALLDQPDDGTLMVGNTNADELSVRQLNRLRNQDFGFVFQQFFLTPNATVLDNVVLPLKIAGVGARERKTRGMAVLEQLEMADKAKNKAVTLSGGQNNRGGGDHAPCGGPRLSQSLGIDGSLLWAVRRRSTVPTLLPFAAVTSWAPGRA